MEVTRAQAGFLPLTQMGYLKNMCLIIEKQTLAKPQAIQKQIEHVDRHNYPNGVLCIERVADKLGLELLNKHIIYREGE